MNRKLDHIGIAVPSLEEALPFWSEGLGLEVSAIETVKQEGVKVAFLAAGGCRIELLEPTDSSSAIARHLERRGGGIHHVTLEVADLDAALELARDKGGEVIGDAPRPGAGDRAVAFLHPRSTGGVLVELVQATPGASGGWRMEAGSAVLLYLHTPQEKLWGVLRRLDATGVIVEAVDLGSFDNWLAQVERGESVIAGPSVLFIPMGRLEKMLLDRSSGDLPSLSERFLRRIGRSVQEVLGA